MRATKPFTAALNLGLVLGALLFAPVSAHAGAEGPQVTDYRKTYVTDGDFSDVRYMLEVTITGRGIVINNVAHIGSMLSRTAKDVGASAQVYQEAEAFEFCSSILSRKMMEADPHNIIFCPYVIAVYTLPGEPGRVYLSYRRPQLVGNEASKASLTEVEKLLDSIIDETLH